MSEFSAYFIFINKYDWIYTYYNIILYLFYILFEKKWNKIPRYEDQSLYQ